MVGTHIEVTEVTCFLCHFKGQKTARELNPVGGCPMCHQPPKEDIQLAGGTRFNHKDFVDARGIQCQKRHLDAVRGDVAAASDLLARARRDFDFVVRAKGIHNPDLAEAILTESKKAAEQAVALSDK